MDILCLHWLTIHLRNIFCFWLTFSYGHASWAEWWSYEGINGPLYWGLTNQDWKLCKHGRQQSPINIEPSRLLYDPNLKHLKFDYSLVNGVLINTGRDFTVEIKSEGYNFINVSLGPLSYTYRVSQLKFHLSNNDSFGSEHKVSDKSFPAEMHVIAYNSDLYTNLTEAAKNVKGLATIAVFIEVGKELDKSFYYISKDVNRLTSRGNKALVEQLSLYHILPKTTEYVTYEGSMTQPGCYETVTWILLNKPLRISRQQLTDLRVLFSSGGHKPNMPLEINSRSAMHLNHRVVRTNINLNSQRRSRLCTMERDMFYQVNTRYMRT